MICYTATSDTVGDQVTTMNYEVMSYRKKADSANYLFLSRAVYLYVKKVTTLMF